MGASFWWHSSKVRSNDCIFLPVHQFLFDLVHPCGLFWISGLHHFLAIAGLDGICHQVFCHTEIYFLLNLFLPLRVWKYLKRQVPQILYHLQIFFIHSWMNIWSEFMVSSPKLWRYQTLAQFFSGKLISWGTLLTTVGQEGVTTLPPTPGLAQKCLWKFPLWCTPSAEGGTTLISNTFTWGDSVIVLVVSQVIQDIKYGGVVWVCNP